MTRKRCRTRVARALRRWGLGWAEAHRAAHRLLERVEPAPREPWQRTLTPTPEEVLRHVNLLEGEWWPPARRVGEDTYAIPAGLSWIQFPVATVGTARRALEPYGVRVVASKVWVSWHDPVGDWVLLLAPKAVEVRIEPSAADVDRLVRTFQASRKGGWQ